MRRRAARARAAAAPRAARTPAGRRAQTSGTPRARSASTRCTPRTTTARTPASSASTSRARRPTSTSRTGAARRARATRGFGGAKGAAARRYDELRESCENIPCILVANKIDIDYQVTRKNFKFASSKGIPFYFVSAADGTNVVKVFRAAIEAALDWKKNGEDFMTEALRLVEGP